MDLTSPPRAARQAVRGPVLVVRTVLLAEQQRVRNSCERVAETPRGAQGQVHALPHGLQILGLRATKAKYGLRGVTHHIKVSPVQTVLAEYPG